jgi:hypothetical protein
MPTSGGGSKPEASTEAALKELVEAYRRYASDARQAIEAPKSPPSLEDLEREYSRLEKRWRLVRKQLDRAFPQDSGKKGADHDEAQLPGLHVELKLAAEQAARTYALLAAIDSAQSPDQMLEGGKYPLLNVGPLEAARILDELDESRKQPPPYCYVVTAVYGAHSREAARAHARCRTVFREGPPLMRRGWRSYQIFGPRLARWAGASPRGKELLRLMLARPILRAAGPAGLGRWSARGWLRLLSVAGACLAWLCFRLGNRGPAGR